MFRTEAMISGQVAPLINRQKAIPVRAVMLPINILLVVFAPFVAL
jgi:hypothetical protein